MGASGGGVGQVIPTRNRTNLPPFPEPVEGLHFVLSVDEKTGRPFDKLREREFAMRQSPFRTLPRRRKRQDRFVSLDRRRADNAQPLTQHEIMADDFGLLFDAVAFERPAGPDRVIIAAERVAREGEENALLMLPDVHHLVNEQALVADMRRTEIVAVDPAFGVKPDRAIGCHRHAARLEQPIFARVDAHRVIIDRVTKY